MANSISSLFEVKFIVTIVPNNTVVIIKCTFKNNFFTLSIGSIIVDLYVTIYVIAAVIKIISVVIIVIAT